ncbi:hypothetical protein LTR08_004897 [Meristemomyces frigidus]|nr:hypothetical protein LTR08_004897 [Meristemomyces frigidus]
MTSSYGVDILQENMNSTAFPGGAYIRTPNHQIPRFTRPHTPFLHQLNPSMPAFQPTGTELQRFGPVEDFTPPQTLSMTHDSNAMAMQRYVAEAQSMHAKDVSRVEILGRRTQQDVQEIRETVQLDLCTLQAQNDRLEAQLGQMQKQIMGIDIARQPYLAIEQQGSSQGGRVEELAEKSSEDACDFDDGHVLGVSPCASRLPFSRPPSSTSSNDVPVTNGSSIRHETPTHTPARHAHRGMSPRTVVITAPAVDIVLDVKAETTTEHSTAVAKPQYKASYNDASTQTVLQASAAWQPLAVRQMPAPPAIDLSNNIETFTWEFLQLNLNGHQWSPGFYFIAHEPILKSKAFWMLEGEFEPFLPSAPGLHGAKLTAFFNETDAVEGEAPVEENYYDTPVFVRVEGSNEYRYYGNYSQLRFSDKLDYDHMMENVPEKVRQFWSDQLTDLERPEWVTKALIEHFWSKPAYDGPIPTDEALATPGTAETAATGTSAVMEKRVTNALRQYADQLKDWERETNIEVNFLKSSSLMNLFEQPDAAEKPGLRFWFEYLQCVGYDHKLYNCLVALKSMPLPKPKATPWFAKTRVASRTPSTIQLKTPRSRSRSRNDSVATSLAKVVQKADTAATTVAASPTTSTETLQSSSAKTTPLGPAAVAAISAEKALQKAGVALGRIVKVPSTGIETLTPSAAPAEVQSPPAPLESTLPPSKVAHAQSSPTPARGPAAKTGTTATKASEKPQATYTPPHMKAKSKAPALEAKAPTPGPAGEAHWCKLERELQAKWAKAVPGQAWEAADDVAPWDVVDQRPAWEQRERALGAEIEALAEVPAWDPAEDMAPWDVGDGGVEGGVVGGDGEGRGVVGLLSVKADTSSAAGTTGEKAVRVETASKVEKKPHPTAHSQPKSQPQPHPKPPPQHQTQTPPATAAPTSQHPPTSQPTRANAATTPRKGDEGAEKTGTAAGVRENPFAAPELLEAARRFQRSATRAVAGRRGGGGGFGFEVGGAGAGGRW